MISNHYTFERKTFVYKLTYKDMYTGFIFYEFIESHLGANIHLYKFSENKRNRNQKKRLLNCNKLKP